MTDLCLMGEDINNLFFIKELSISEQAMYRKRTLQQLIPLD